MATRSLLQLTFTCYTCGYQWRSRSHRTCQECGALWGDTPAPEVGPYVTIKEGSSHGIGVYATQDTPRGTVIERCPAFVLVTHVTPEGLHYTDKTFTNSLTEPYAPDGDGVERGGLALLAHMVIPWRRDTIKCLVLGYGMLYNHSSMNWNTIALPWVNPQTKRRYLDFITWNPVKEGAEFRVNYGDRDRIWFEPDHEEEEEAPPFSPEEGREMRKLWGRHERSCVEAGELPNEDPLWSQDMLNYEKEA